MNGTRLAGVTVLADDVVGFGRFLRDGLGFTIDVEEEHYLATNSRSVRLAVFSRQGMLANTGGHPDSPIPPTQVPGIRHRNPPPTPETSWLEEELEKLILQNQPAQVGAG